MVLCPTISTLYKDLTKVSVLSDTLENLIEGKDFDLGICMHNY